MTCDRATFYTTIAANQVRDYMPAEPVMVTATSYWGYGQRRSAARRADGEIPAVTLPAHVPEVCADSGGFVAAYKLGGKYPFSFEAYIRWLRTIPNLSWAALPDLPVERELAASFSSIRERQELTLRWAAQLWGDGFEDGSEGFETRLRQPWAWVPTIQGRDVADYVWMAREMEVLLASQEMESDWLAGASPDELDDAVQLTGIDATAAGKWGEHVSGNRRIGIGSLCRRQSLAEVVAIVRAVRDVLPGQRFHLWGVKLGAIPALRAAGLLDCVASIDSAAWNGRIASQLEDQKASALSQAAHSWQIAHPLYVSKVRGQLDTPPPTTVQLGLAM